MTWLTPDTNLIKRGRSPSEFVEEINRRNYNGSEKEFSKTLESHFINNEAYQFMKEGNFEKFIEEREKTMLLAIGERIGADTGG